MRVTIIVLAYNGARYLPACLASLADLPAGFHTLVVDNGSRDESVAIARAAPGQPAVIENNRNLGFSGGMNVGMRAALGLDARPELGLAPADVVVLLNQDTCCLPGWAAAIVAPLDDPRVAAVGCAIYADDQRTLQHVGGRVAEPRGLTSHIGAGELDHGQYHQILPVEYATGAALALRASALLAVGLFDERYNPAYMEEVDLCARLRRAGFEIVVNPAARLVHYEGISTPDSLLRAYWANRGRLLFLIKSRELATLAGPFATAERDAIRADRSAPIVRGLKRAYLQALADLPDWYAARAAFQGRLVPAHERAQLQALLADLRDACIVRDAELTREAYQ